MSEPGRGSATAGESALASARLAAAALVAGPLVLLGLVLLVPPPAPWRALVAPAALLGFVALAAGNRLYARLLERSRTRAGAAERLLSLRSATVAALALTEATAILGVLAFHFSREPFALAGLAVHLILAGAVWPTRARLEHLLEAEGDTGRRAGPT